jgi:hypothetical protein
VGLYDLGRITGFDATAWQQTLGVDADFLESRVVPVVVAPELVDIGREVMQSSVFETASPAAQAAMGPGGIGIVAMHQNIRDFIASAGTDYRAVVDGMQTWGVSLDDINAALFNVPGSDAYIAGLIAYINAPPPAPPPRVVVAAEVVTDVTQAPTGSVVDQPVTVLTPETVVTLPDTTLPTGSVVDQPVTVPTDTTADIWFEAQVGVYGPDGTPYGTYSAAKRAGLRDDQISYEPPPVITSPGAPAMLNVPNDLTQRTEAQKIAWYRAALAAGFSNEEIRAAVEAKFGRVSDTDWTYLRAKAAQTAQAATAGGGAGLLIAAAAAYFLLG